MRTVLHFCVEVKKFASPFKKLIPSFAFLYLFLNFLNGRPHRFGRRKIITLKSLFCEI